MPYPHVIRLRGPWKYQLEAPANASTDISTGEPIPAGPSQRISVPCNLRDVLGPEFVGRIFLTRYFNLPTGLQPHERVWLCCDDARPFEAIFLNDERLGDKSSAPHAGFEITRRLQSRNQLRIEISVSSPHEPLGGPNEVRLEIRSS